VVVNDDDDPLCGMVPPPEGGLTTSRDHSVKRRGKEG